MIFDPPAGFITRDDEGNFQGSHGPLESENYEHLAMLKKLGMLESALNGPELVQHDPDKRPEMVNEDL